MNPALPLSDAQARAVVAAARALLGTRFLHQGRTRRGIDCIGLIVLAFAAVGVVLDDRTDYGRLPADRKLEQALTDNLGPSRGRPRTLADLRVGDVVSMAWGGEAAHVALVVDHPEGLGLIHTWSASNKVIEHRLTDEIRGLIRGVHRPTGEDA